MTREEAAELLLKGESPFERCKICAGNGFLIAINTYDYRRSCSNCIPESDTKVGSGRVWRAGYVEAYAILGLELPIVTWKPPHLIAL